MPHQLGEPLVPGHGEERVSIVHLEVGEERREEDE